MVSVLRPVRRYNGLPLPNAAIAVAGTLIVSFNPRRIGLLLFNQGGGNVYYDANQYLGNDKGIIPPGGALQWMPGSGQPGAPVNSIYALGDAGADLRVTETVMMTLDTAQPGA